jgi:hypothetical protein
MSVPPGLPQGPYGHPGMPPRQGPASAGFGARLRRHRVWFAAGAVAVVIAIIAAATGNSPGTKPASSLSPAPQPAVAALVAPPLACAIRVSSKHPRDHTRVTVHVRTAARARVVLTSALALTAGSTSAGRASARGTWTRHLRVGDSAPAVRVTIAVHVTHGDRRGKCQTWVRPRPAATAATPSAHPTSAPPATAPPPPAPSPTTAPPPAPAGCYPKTDSGNCYEPGEFCRDDDHGVKGVAGDGKPIVCEDNDGWRWEPY